MNNKERYLEYDDIWLVPKYGELSSRSEANTEIKIKNKTFHLPVIPANMSSVMDIARADWMSKNNYMYILPRFNIDNYKFVVKANKENWQNISISVGVNEDSERDLKLISQMGLKVNTITIDIANGNCLKMIDRIKLIKDLLPDTTIIAGNIVTADAVERLEKAGADILKVGIGGGLACTTKWETGIYSPMFSMIQEIWQAKQWKTLIIADGGIRCVGDICKALCYANFVMCGSLFASCSDATSKLIDGKKQYFGSASFECKQNTKNIEGTLIELAVSVSYQERLNNIRQSLQSSISYLGGKDLSQFGSAEWFSTK